MDQAAEILVIIVSSVLSVFLIVAIILGIFLIKLTTQIRELTKKAQNTVETLDTAVTNVGKVTSPIFIAGLVNRFIKKVTKKGK